MSAAAAENSDQEIILINFAIVVHQNRFLASDATEMDAVLEVQATTDSDVTVSPTSTLIIIIDCSSSMSVPLAKIFAAKEAAKAAIESLRPGTRFAVIAGTETARLVFPPSGLASASDESKVAAKAAVSRMRANGGTAMSTWLALAAELVRAHPATIPRAILLTDGQNVGESRARLTAVLEECKGHFRCDCRGIGEDWVAEDLIMITRVLLGAARPIEKASDLVEDFRAIAREAMGKVVSEAWLRVWVPFRGKVVFLKQVYPTINDLTGRAVRVDDNTSGYPTGAWGTEKRHYHLRIGGLNGVDAESASRVGRVRFVMHGEESEAAVVLAQWTDDPLQLTQISSAVAEATGQVEIALEIQLGAHAIRADDDEKATAHLGRAVRLAHEAGDQSKIDLLARMVEILDRATGTVRLRPDLGHRIVEHSELLSTWTRDVGADADADAGGDDVPTATDDPGTER
ncbi:VWA domain-containing protein [Frankia sp. CiP3]|uniref:VWA domain-containing protein n=1 Tax=Frankia sp. CiP3 TaxID=2880971 RepID=UPI001EF5B59C|nr:VWA domain-containing protein [Frankia sp. CiP3]